MELAKITANGQTTIPDSICKAANLAEGDVIAFGIKGDHVVIHKLTPDQDGYLRLLSSSLSEWASPEDEEAWRDL